MSQSAREGVGVGMLYDVQNKNVFSLRLKVCVLLVWRTLSGRVFQASGGYYAEGSVAELSLDRDKNRVDNNHCDEIANSTSPSASSGQFPDSVDHQ